MTAQRTIAQHLRIDVVSSAGARSPHYWPAPAPAPSALFRGLRYALALSAGFWCAAVAIGCWLLLA